MTRNRCIAVISGDGIGADVTPEEARTFDVRTDAYPIEVRFRDISAYAEGKTRIATYIPSTRIPRGRM